MPIRAAVKSLLLPLIVTMLCAATPQSAADPAVPLQIEPSEEVHAAVTDTPIIVDMSHSDPKTWHSLPPPPQEHSPSSEEFDYAGLVRGAH